MVVGIMADQSYGSAASLITRYLICSESSGPALSA